MWTLPSTSLQLVHQAKKDSLVLRGYQVGMATPVSPAPQDRWEGKDLLDHQGVLDLEVSE